MECNMKNMHRTFDFFYVYDAPFRLSNRPHMHAFGLWKEAYNLERTHACDPGLRNQWVWKMNFYDEKDKDFDSQLFFI